MWTVRFRSSLSEFTFSSLLQSLFKSPSNRRGIWDAKSAKQLDGVWEVSSLVCWESSQSAGDQKSLRIGRDLMNCWSRLPQCSSSRSRPFYCHSPFLCCLEKFVLDLKFIIQNLIVFGAKLWSVNWLSQSNDEVCRDAGRHVPNQTELGSDCLFNLEISSIFNVIFHTWCWRSSDADEFAEGIERKMLANCWFSPRMHIDPADILLISG